MVTLYLTALDQQVNHREFSCQLSSLEANLDILNSIVAQGHTLLTAYMIEDGQRTNLPLAAFDGLPTAIGMKALESEWQRILSEPQSFDLIHQQELIDIARRRIELYNDTILAHHQMIDRLTGWIKRNQDKTPLSPSRIQLIQSYKSQLDGHRAFLAKAYFHTNLVTNRLNQLVA